MSSYSKISCEIIIENDDGDTVRFLQCISVDVDTSYDTITDTAKVVLPRDNRWIIKDSNDLNTYQLMDADGFAQNGLFRQGDRIKIKLGYDFNNKTVFQGYLTGIDAKSPFTLHCEDAAWLLKRKRVSLTLRSKQNKLSDFIDELLEGSGVMLHPETKAETIQFGSLRFSNVTIAQIMNGWKKRGLISYIKDGKLLIGRSILNSSNIFFSSTTDGYKPPTFNMEYDVVKDNLSLTTLDKRSILVRAQSILRNNRRIMMDVVLDPAQKKDTPIIIEYKDGRRADSGYAEVELATGEIISHNKDRIGDPSTYQVRTFTTSAIEDINEIFEDVKSFFFKLVDTGFEGNFTAFGDHNLQPATTLNVIDPTNPEKEGEFVIKSVRKTWGQHGYRQVVQIPHKFKNFNASQ